MSFNRKALAWGLGLFLLLALVPGVMAQEVTVQVSDHPELGMILTDGEGMTLYMYTRDAENVSSCYDQCAVNWPPLLVDEGAEPVAGEGLTGELGVIDRTDGGRQVTYNGMPLYYWIQDSQPGDATGQGVGDVWFVISPGDTFASFPGVQESQDAQEGADATAEPTAAAEDGDATTTEEQPSELPETGGENLPWMALALVVGGAAVVAAAAGLARARRPR